jgi:hypothetical protein
MARVAKDGERELMTMRWGLPLPLASRLSPDLK